VLVARASQKPASAAASPADGETTELVRLTPEGAQVLAQLPAGHGAWLTGSACGDGVALSFGGDSAAMIGSIAADGTFSLHASLPLALGDVVHDGDAAHDRVRHVCTGAGRSFVLARDAKDNLLAVTCQRDLPECQKHVVASGVQTFAAL